METPASDFPGSVLERRRWSRNYVTLPIPIFEAGAPNNRGWIENISENGLGILGIQSRVGETKSLVIDAPELGFDDPLSIDALCRWRGADQNGDPLGGYEITAIHDESLAYLRRLIRGLTFGT
jgi:hypothetical protein